MQDSRVYSRYCIHIGKGDEPHQNPKFYTGGFVLYSFFFFNFLSGSS